MVDYEFYSSVYHGGAIPDDDWAELEARAADQLRRYKRIYTVTAPDEQAEGTAVFAERYESCMVKPASLGGSSNVGTPGRR